MSKPKNVGPVMFCPPLSLRGLPEDEGCQMEDCKLWDGEQCSIHTQDIYDQLFEMDVLRDT